jgi:LacI family transcriptional regulator
LDWNVVVEDGGGAEADLADRLASLRLDGIISNFDIPLMADYVAEARLPAIGFGCGQIPSAAPREVPYMSPNDGAIARLAANHLLSRRLTNFALCGFPPNTANGWSGERETAFFDYLASDGHHTHVFRLSPSCGTTSRIPLDCLGTWLLGLPRPVGVFAVTDRLGAQVVEACQAFGLKVPNDVNVVSVDNDEFLCNLNHPALSSIEPGGKQLGYQAAKMLASIMQGEKAPSGERVLVDPVELVTRRSTDNFSTEDAAVMCALKFISESCNDRITVQDVMKHVGLSRSSLDKKFLLSLGLSVRAAIVRVRMDQAKSLLSHTDIALKEIAWKLGFASVQHMTTLFRCSFGVPPGHYRQLKIGSAEPSQTSNHRTRTSIESSAHS